MSRAAVGPVQGDGAESVRDMFSRIAPTYDLLNTVLSLGLDERWRREAMQTIQERALDLFDERGFANVTIEQVAAAAASRRQRSSRPRLSTVFRRS